jgi:hypothetical protein
MTANQNNEICNSDLGLGSFIMRTVHFVLMVAATVALNCFGQDFDSQSQSNGIARPEITQKVLYADWLNYATNNPYTMDLIRQKYTVDSQIAVLQKQRAEFIAEDHYNTYTNTPYLIIDEAGHNRAYSSRAAYDDEIIGGLIKSSLNINNEIIQQKNLYFAAHGSNVDASVGEKLAPPGNLRVINN